MTFSTVARVAGRPSTRKKIFGQPRLIPLDREAKVRIKTRALALMRRTIKGKAYGEITAKAVAVLDALMWTFHNNKDGRCFPSYEAIAEAAGCARSTVHAAIRALEAAGLLTWLNRLCRVKWREPNFAGIVESRLRVFRTSNAYQLHDQRASAAIRLDVRSKSEKPTGTTIQDSSSLNRLTSAPLLPELQQIFDSWREQRMVKTSK